jgi:hemoglobin
MKDAHAGMNLEAKDFNALAEDLQLSMDKEQVPFRAQNQLLAKLAPMERPIVTK